MVFGWFKSERRERRRKVRLDRQYLETRARRFLKNYLSAAQSGKPLFYRAVEDASIQCHPSVTSEIEDAQIAEATSRAAMQVVLQREERSAIEKADDQTADFVTDAYATVGIAYHRAAGIYTDDKKMQELGTAAVHLLTMATSYLKAQP
jgi:hypothetical protein